MCGDAINTRHDTRPNNARSANNAGAYVHNNNTSENESRTHRVRGYKIPHNTVRFFWIFRTYVSRNCRRSTVLRDILRTRVGRCFSPAEILVAVQRNDETTTAGFHRLLLRTIQIDKPFTPGTSVSTGTTAKNNTNVLRNDTACTGVSCAVSICV